MPVAYLIIIGLLQHLLSHFCNHICEFGNIPMYSTEIAELAHKTQIKDACRQLNKNNVACHIVHSFGRQHAIRMRLSNLESPKCRDADLSGDVFHHSDRTASTLTAAAPVVRSRVLNGGREDVSNMVDFSRILGVLLEMIYRQLIQYSRHNLRLADCLPEDHAMLRSRMVEPLTQLEILVLAFQEADV